MSQILTRQAFENAIRVNGAVGGSTKAVLHLLAIAGRIGVPLSLQDWDECGRDVPSNRDVRPARTHHGVCAHHAPRREHTCAHRAGQ